MVEALERLLVRILRVPQQPEPPSGDPDSLRVFQAARGFLRYKRLQWLLRQGSLVVGFVFALGMSSRIFSGARWDADDFVEQIARSRDVPAAVAAILSQFHDVSSWLFELGGLDALFIGLFLLQAPVTFAMVEIDYRSRWYMITDRSLRIREGVGSVREQTMTFSNIQNVGIRQGPVQRFFGIADLEVRTAGGGSKTSKGAQRESEEGNLHLARFAGVDNAQEIRDAIRAYLERPSAVEMAPSATNAMQSASEMLEEARGLRAALERIA